MHRRHTKRIAFLSSVLVVFAMILSACGGGNPNQQGSGGAMAPADKQIYRWGELGANDFGSALDPAQIQDQTDVYAIQLYLTGLVQQNDKGVIKDQLAESHTISDGGLTYTFKLRSGLKWSDGAPLTAQDVAYGINRSILPATNSPVAQYLSLIKDFDKVNSGKQASIIGDGVIVQDPTTLVIKLNQPAAYFLYSLTYPTSYPVEKSLVDKYGNKWTDHLSEGGSDGPFKVQSYSHTIGADFVPNPNYYGTKPKLNKVEVHIVGSPDVAYKSYLSHQIDYTIAPVGQLVQIKKRSDFHDVPILGTRMIMMNYLVKPFDNQKIREAFMLALNRQLFTQTLLHGVYIPTNRYIPTPQYGSNPQEVMSPDGQLEYSGNPTLAKQLLQQGLQEEGMTQLPPITFTSPSNSNAVLRANAYIDQWKTVLGVNIKSNPIPDDQFSKILSANAGKTSLQIWEYGWQDDYPDPQDWITKFFDKGADVNYENYGQNNSPQAAEQQALQKQMEAADINQDTTARAKAYNAIEAQLEKEVAYIPIAQLTSYYVLNPKIHGYQENAFGLVDPDDWGNIYVTQ